MDDRIRKLEEKVEKAWDRYTKVTWDENLTAGVHRVKVANAKRAFLKASLKLQAARDDKLVEVAVRVIGEQKWTRKVLPESKVEKWLDKLAEKHGGYEALDVLTRDA